MRYENFFGKLQLAASTTSKKETVKKARTLSSTAKKVRLNKNAIVKARAQTFEAYKATIRDLKKYRMAAATIAKKITKKLEACEAAAAKATKLTESSTWSYSDFSLKTSESVSELVESIEQAFDGLIGQVQDALDSTEGDTLT